MKRIKNLMKTVFVFVLILGMAMCQTEVSSLAYTVEFTHDGYQYVLPGDSEVELAHILDTVGLSGEVTDVSVSDSSLFSAEKNEDGKWIVTAHKAFSTTEWMKVTINGVEYEITVTDDPGTETMTWTVLQTLLDQGGTVTLIDDVTAGEGDSALVIPENKTVTLDLNGHTIDRGLKDKTAIEDGNVITVLGNLTLTDSSTEKSGKLTGGNTTGNGGGVYVAQNGTFTMEGGKIDHCTATGENSDGGGVYNYGAFTMEGGTISDCTATGGCTATGDYSQGGGVYVGKNGAFTMEGGTI
ncbi:MAG: hypothetical protein J6P16_05285, partial [Eubacterium sp.]|nr:hypothetical protein [Eubacterium sp.]